MSMREAPSEVPIFVTVFIVLLIALWAANRPEPAYVPDDPGICWDNVGGAGEC